MRSFVSVRAKVWVAGTLGSLTGAATRCLAKSTSSSNVQSVMFRAAGHAPNDTALRDRGGDKIAVTSPQKIGTSTRDEISTARLYSCNLG